MAGALCLEPLVQNQTLLDSLQTGDQAHVSGTYVQAPATRRRLLLQLQDGVDPLEGDLSGAQPAMPPAPPDSDVSGTDIFSQV